MLPPLLATISEPSLLLNSRYDLYVIAATTGMTSETLGQGSTLAGIAVTIQERGVDLLHAGLDAQVGVCLCLCLRWQCSSNGSHIAAAGLCLKRLA